MVEGHPSVVFAGEPDFRADFSRGDAWHVLVCIQVTALNKEHSEAVIVDGAVLLGDFDSCDDQRII